MKKIVKYIKRLLIVIGGGGYSYAKYRGYNVVHSTGALRPFVNWLGKYSTLKVSSIFEIGANFGQDADFLRQ
jgi:hypothetical protein